MLQLQRVAPERLTSQRNRKEMHSGAPQKKCKLFADELTKAKIVTYVFWQLPVASGANEPSNCPAAKYPAITNAIKGILYV